MFNTRNEILLLQRQNNAVDNGQSAALAALGAEVGVRTVVPNPAFSWLESEGYEVAAVRKAGDVVIKGRPIERAIAQFGLLNTSVCYVDNVNGNNGNAGTVAAPFLTLAHALKTASFGYIRLISTGVPYAPTDYRSTDTGAGALKIIEGMGPVTIGFTGTDISAGTWTMTSGTGSLVVTGASSSFPTRVLDSGVMIDGMPRPIRQYASLAALNTAGTGWFYDSATTTLHVRMGGADINQVKPRLRAVYSTAATAFMVYAARLAFRNVDIEGVYLWPLQLNGVASWVFLENCVLQYSNNQGIQTEGGHYRMWKTRIHRSRTDGTNIKNGGTVTAVTGLEIDCIHEYPGDAATFGDITRPPQSQAAYNVNCHSNDSFPGGTTILVNGEYSGAQGPVVVAAASAGNPNFTWCMGVKARDSLAAKTGPNGANHAILANQGVVYLDSCETSGSDSDGDLAAIGASGVIYVDPRSIGTQAVAAGGLAVEWTPQ